MKQIPQIDTGVDADDTPTDDMKHTKAPKGVFRIEQPKLKTRRDRNQETEGKTD